MEKIWVNLSDVLFFQEGPGVRNTQYTLEGVKLLNVANLVDGNIDLSTSERYISNEEAYGKYKHFLCDAGDFIVASSGIKVEYVDKKMGFVDESMLPLCMNTSTIRFKVIDSDKLNIRYFMYYLKSHHFKEQLSKHITGSAQLNYGPSHLKKMSIPLLELKVQNVLIEKLDKVQAIIDLRRKEIQELDNLIKARFVELFGDPVLNTKQWKVVIVDEICKCMVPGRDKPKSFSGGIPWITIDDLVVNGITHNSKKGLGLTIKEMEEVNRKAIPVGSVIMSCVGNLGICSLAGCDMVINQQLHSFQCSEVINNVFLMFYLGQRTDYMESVASNTTILYMNKSACNSIPVILPPINLQNQFAAFVQQIDKSKFVGHKLIS